MRKRSLLLGTCLCLVLSLTACGNKNGTVGVTGTPSVSGEATPEATGEATPEATGEATPEATGEAEKSNVSVELGQYKGLEVTMMSIDVTDEEIQAQLDAFNNVYGTPIPSDKKVVEEGDTVNIDYVGKIDGEAFTGGTDAGASLTIGSGQFIEGFESGLLGKNVGDTVDVQCTFPEDYGNADVAGKDAVFTVTINFIDSGEKEPISDAVIAENDVYGNKTVDEYKEYVKNSIKASKEYSANNQKIINIMQKAIDNATFTGLNQSEIDEFTSEMTDDYVKMAETYGMDIESYVYYSFGGMSLEQFNTEMAKASEFNIYQRYLLEEIVKAENVTLTDEEYEEIVADYMTDYGYTDKDQFITDMGGDEVVRHSATLDKAKAIVLDSAVVITE